MQIPVNNQTTIQSCCVGFDIVKHVLPRNPELHQQLNPRYPYTHGSMVIYDEEEAKNFTFRKKT